MQDTIKTLKQEIQTKKDLLRALKLQEKEQKKREKKQQVFGETKFGKFCFKTLEVVSKPVARLYEYANTNYEDPKGVASRKLTIKAGKLIVKAGNTSSLDDEANELAVELAKHVVKMEDMNSPDIDSINVLRNEVIRLRSVETKENNELFNKISELVDKEFGNVEHSYISCDSDSR